MVRVPTSWMRHILLLAALLCTTPALAQRSAFNSTVGAASTPTVAANRVGTTDWRWMTSGIRAGEALWRNFWRGEHAGRTQRLPIGRDGRGNAFRGHPFVREVRGGTPDILTGADQRVDILTGRPID